MVSQRGHKSHDTLLGGKDAACGVTPPRGVWGLDPPENFNYEDALRVASGGQQVNFCMGKTSCTTKESTLLVTSSYSSEPVLYHRPSAETLSPAKGREVQPSFEPSLLVRN